MCCLCCRLLLPCLCSIAKRHTPTTHRGLIVFWTASVCLFVYLFCFVSFHFVVCFTILLIFGLICFFSRFRQKKTAHVRGSCDRGRRRAGKALGKYQVEDNTGPLPTMKGLARRYPRGYVQYASFFRNCFLRAYWLSIDVTPFSRYHTCSGFYHWVWRGNRTRLSVCLFFVFFVRKSTAGAVKGSGSLHSSNRE